MKKYITGITIFLLALFIAACCKKNDDILFNKYDVAKTQALAQVYVATVNAARNVLFVDGQAISWSTTGLGGIFPSTLANGFTLDPGIRNFLVKDTLPTSTQVPLSFQQQVDAGKKYTIFLYDTITSPKVKTVETNIVIPSDTTARLRFANFFYSKSAIPAFDIFSKRRNISVASNLKATDVTDFMPFPSYYNDTLIFSEAGTSNIAFTLNGINLTPKKSYTLVLRGRYKIATGTDGMGATTYVTYE